ncbi:MAG: YlmC/YmxH family sporulation protein [Veillonellaceae bacterium]|jgi:YlmC/YmxH family sporulation protein|nr:YlmC/YmxH family sporulation protein [Veillonellaceae bacterium]
MRLSDFTGKEVINLGDGARLGVIDDCELTVDARTGRIHSLVLPRRGGLFSILGDSRASAIPWRSIRRIGDDIIIVDLSDSFDGLFNSKGRDGGNFDTY